MKTDFRPRNHEIRWFHKSPFALPTALLALLIAVVAFTVITIEQADARRAKGELASTAAAISTAIYRRAAENTAYLRAAAIFVGVQGPDTINREEFAKLASDFENARDDYGALGVGWIERVKVADLKQFELRQRSSGSANFAVWPQPARTGRRDQIVWPITYLLPDTPYNQTAIGFDMQSDRLRYEAMLQAAKQGRPIATAPVQLIQDRGGAKQPGFLIVMPVMRATGNGPKELVGFVYSAFRARKFLESAVKIFSTGGQCVTLYDGTRTEANRLAALCQPDGGAMRSTYQTALPLAGRTWLIELSERPESSLTLLSQVVLVLGTMLTALLTWIAYLFAVRAAEDRKVVEWLQGQVSIRTNLTRELNHRVKNTLANVLSIVALTRRRSHNIDDFAEALSGRIRALSATHDLLTRNEWGATSVEELVAAELAPYMELEENHILMDGPQISLAPNDALSLGLAVHELATNAAKYGALSTLEGTVSVSWAMIGADLAELRWEEAGGPAVSAPVRSGFGRDLIEKIVAHELKSPIELRFEPTGVICVMRVPVRQPRSFNLRSGVQIGA